MEPAVKLLIVDDDEVDRMIIKRSLRTAQVAAEIYTATLGSEALEALGQTTFDFIFIDFMLPDMNGLELLQKIRENGITTPVQVVTSQGDERIAVEAMKTGASDYLPKTLLTPEGISQSIRSAIRLHKIEQERLHTQDQLIRTQKQLDTVINGAPIILWAVDKEGFFTMARGKGLALIDRQEQQAVGTSLFEAYSEFPPILTCARRTLQGHQSTCTVNIRGTWFDCLFLPQLNANKEVTGMIGVSYDITPRIEIEEELKKAKDEALTMAQIKEQFLANMSHEIRTPMNGIVGLTEVLAKTPLTTTQKDYLQGIQTSANSLMVIINDLLDFSKIEAGKITFEVIPFELKPLLKQLLTILEIQAKDHKNTIKLLFDEEIPPFLGGDPFRLSQILNNLLGNAIKFTENGIIRLHVEVIAQQEDLLQIEFTVQDTGIGIPKDKLDTIFEKFTQGSSDTTRRFGGTGLGLSIAKELIEVQGGHITVASEIGKGSTFRFVLPFRKTAHKPESHLGSHPHQLQTHLKHARVLLAEDNKVNQMLVNQVLQEQHIQVTHAENGLQVLELLRQNPYDLILMDMQMPVMDGYETMQYIRVQMPAQSKIPIIALTAHASPGQVKKCLSAGADAYVSKPFKAEELLRKISALLGAKKPENQPSPLVHAQEEELQVDLSYLQDFANGNRDFMMDILTLFMNQTPGLIQELARAIGLSNWAETRTIAHKIKPSLSLVGIKQLEELNATIEQSALNQTNLEQLPALVQKMTTLFHQSVIALKEEVNTLKKKKATKG
ncbi:response regulator [Rufibacter radiotolerans]|uniref:response regulator n=1 Tax=Rufibacter radiotolerans TaxID=1379910 RepID=UPI000A5643DF|nr:response regulator [Rufibacter radiotolerans]